MKQVTHLLLAAWLTACSSLSPSRQPQTEPQKSEKLKIYDAHAHYDDPSSGFSESMLKDYQENNVVAATIHISRKTPGKVFRAKVDKKIALCAALVPGIKSSDIEKGLRDQTYQCLKVYLAYIPKWASDAFYVPYYKMAEKYQVPVVFHTGDPIDKMAKVKYADPLTVDEIAVTYPKVKFVLAHLGNPWFDSAAEVVYKNDNVYADTSALMIGDISKANPESIEELMIKPVHWFFLYVENPQKLMFGTDWPLTTVGPHIEAMKKAIPKEHWEKFFYQNAMDVFKPR